MPQQTDRCRSKPPRSPPAETDTHVLARDADWNRKMPLVAQLGRWDPSVV